MMAESQFTSRHLPSPLLQPHTHFLSAFSIWISPVNSSFFSLIPRNWILMNSAMNNQARNYFPISSPDIPPSLYISGINTWSVLKTLHQVMQDLIRSLKFWANQVSGGPDSSIESEDGGVGLEEEGSDGGVGGGWSCREGKNPSQAATENTKWVRFD